MNTAFDRHLARLLLEVCRYTYAAHFHNAANRSDEADALDWIRRDPQYLRDPGLLSEDDKVTTSVASVVPCRDRNIVCYMGTKTDFTSPRNFVSSVADWVQDVRGLLVPFRLAGEHLGRPESAEVELGVTATV